MTWPLFLLALLISWWITATLAIRRKRKAAYHSLKNNLMGLKELLDKSIDEMKQEIEHDKNRKVIEEIAIRPEWQEMYDKQKAIQDQLEKLVKEAELNSKYMWAKIRIDLDDDRSMRINKDKNVIEVMEEK